MISKGFQKAQWKEQEQKSSVVHPMATAGTKRTWALALSRRGPLAVKDIDNRVSKDQYYRAIRGGGNLKIRRTPGGGISGFVNVRLAPLSSTRSLHRSRSLKNPAPSHLAVLSLSGICGHPRQAVEPDCLRWSSRIRGNEALRRRGAE